jgi:hypothetical protein
MCYPDTYLHGFWKTSVDKTYGSLSCECGKYTSIQNFDWEITWEASEIPVILKPNFRLIFS